MTPHHELDLNPGLGCKYMVIWPMLSMPVQLTDIMNQSQHYFPLLCSRLPLLNQLRAVRLK